MKFMTQQVEGKTSNRPCRSSSFHQCHVPESYWGSLNGESITFMADDVDNHFRFRYRRQFKGLENASHSSQRLPRQANNRVSSCHHHASVFIGITTACCCMEGGDVRVKQNKPFK